MKVIDERIEFEGTKKVWIGDPCYVIADEFWHDVCNQIFAGTNDEVNHVITVGGKPFIQCGTMYGDGVYTSMSGFEYGVDAGCLAVVPIDMIAPEKMGEAERLGKFFEAADYVALMTNEKGIFSFFSNGDPLEIIETGDEA